VDEKEGKDKWRCRFYAARLAKGVQNLRSLFIDQVYSWNEGTTLKSLTYIPNMT